ncbi:MAG TPA: sugar phosphate isomerase/epimerase family protein [Cyclobacteriaceae bacterium]|nr:sugar phosphate isomerase/epimerase family protein [Cyclobacteriaceae bacterium]
MKKLPRREFLQTTGLLLTGAMLGSSFRSKKKPLLSFSTLGCPEWTLKQIVDFAAQHQYQGIEVRGILKQLDLSQCAEFKKENIAATLRMLSDKKLNFVNLGSSSTLHFAEGNERKKNLEEGKRFIDLAHELHCPHIRVFPNNFPKDQEKSATMDLIAKGLLELGNHANGSNVDVLMETHGDLLFIDDLEKVMKAAAHKKVGLIWDVTNMWTKTKEAPKEAYARLKSYIRHTHIKDAKVIGDKVQYVLLGQGEVPIFDAIDALSDGGYKGYYSFEWEKLWHPEIEAPEIAIADYPKVMNKWFEAE